MTTLAATDVRCQETGQSVRDSGQMPPHCETGPCGPLPLQRSGAAETFVEKALAPPRVTIDANLLTSAVTVIKLYPTILPGN